MTGTLYGVGVGPGDPELMTLKAVRLLKSCAVIAVPKTGAGEGVALQIARAAVPELAQKQVLELAMPMTRDKALLEKNYDELAAQITALLARGKSVALLTLGDPTIYSTSIYIHKRVLAAGFAAELVPGVPSFCAAAARLNIPLTEGAQALHVLPASYAGAEQGLGLSGTKVLMKTGKAMGEVKRQLKEHGLYATAQMVQKCGMAGEQIYHSMDDVAEDSSYFSIIVVKDGEAL